MKEEQPSGMDGCFLIWIQVFGSVVFQCVPSQAGMWHGKMTLSVIHHLLLKPLFRGKGR
ncbi:hypothetical protein HMPREF9374_0110 [Desmospora sp. 8437]|nr:hypothetical protein HMPREF9374_0110 [Desmospora sp. 8437]